MIHEAGEYVDWVQKCVRCGYVLNDHRNAAWPHGQEPPTGYKVGASVDVNESPGFRSSVVVDDPPDCQPVH